MPYKKVFHVMHSTRLFDLLAVDWQKTGWETQCSVEDWMMNKTPCDSKFLECIHATSSESKNSAKSTNVFTKCNTISINYGIFTQAMKMEF